MISLEEILERWIPYRLQAIETLQFAWDWIGESDAPREVIVLVDGHKKLQGNVAAIANPMIEIGFIHARALLEFNAELRKQLKSAGFLERDARGKERKKYGQKGARARFQFSKR